MSDPNIPSIDQRKSDPSGTMVVLHGTEQHMITYTISDDQLEFIGSAGTRFTVWTAVATAFWSATITCALSGLTVVGSWTAGQIAAFAIAPIVTGILAISASILAKSEFTQHGRQVERIRTRSYAPGTVKTLGDLVITSDKTVRRV